MMDLLAYTLSFLNNDEVWYLPIFYRTRSGYQMIHSFEQFWTDVYQDYCRIMKYAKRDYNFIFMYDRINDDISLIINRRIYYRVFGQERRLLFDSTLSVPKRRCHGRYNNYGDYDSDWTEMSNIDYYEIEKEKKILAKRKPNYDYDCCMVEIPRQSRRKNRHKKMRFYRDIARWIL